MSGLIDGASVNLKKTEDIPGWVACGRLSESNPSAQFEIFYSDENQLPAMASGGACTVLFQGFVQNRKELFALLEEKGREDLSDSELILRCYLRWREDFLQKVKGVYLLAVWDARDRSLLCVRDRCGIFPIFYSQKNGQIFFSVSPENLVHHPNISKQVNRSAFVDFLCHRRPVPEETFYSDVKRVLPGHAIRFSASGNKPIRYWYCFPPDGDVEYITDLSDSSFDQALDEAVGRCLDLGPSSIFLSGGLDSVSVASVAVDLARRNGSPLPLALSIGFQHPQANEIERQRAVAKGLGMDIVLLPINEVIPKEGLLWAGLELSKEWSQPMWNFWQPIYLPLARAGKERGRNIIMNGAGGDEWLNVNPMHSADLIRMMDFPALRRLIRSIMKSYNLPPHHLLRYLLWTNGLRPVLGLYAKRLIRQVSPDILTKRLKAKLQTMQPDWVAADPQLQKEASERLEVLTERYLNKSEPKGRYGFYSSTFNWYFIDTIASMELEQQYEAAQKTGSFIIPPYYDHDLLELLLKISPEVQLKGGMEKGLVRLAVARRFPELRFERQKKVSAMLYWQSLIRGEGPTAWEKMGGARLLIELGIIDKRKVPNVVQEAFTSTSAFKNYPVWDMLCTEAWLRSR